MAKKNYQYIILELLLVMRGSRSSAELSQAMGYYYNQVKRWENGEKQLRWDEFCKYCQVLEIPLAKILLTVFQFDRPDPLKFLTHLHDNKFPVWSIQEISAQLHRHPSAIRRYLEGETFPDVEFVLAYIDSDVNRLSAFLSMFLPADTESPLKEMTAEDLKKMVSLGEHPVASGIEGWLSTIEYQNLEKHDDAFLAEKVGLTAKDVQHILSLMVASETIVRNERTGKYAVTYNTIETSGVERKLVANMFQFWAERVASYYSKGDFSFRGPVRTRGAVRVVPVSQEVSRQINDIILRADTEIRAVLDQSNKGPYDDVRVIVQGAYSTLDLS